MDSEPATNEPSEPPIEDESEPAIEPSEPTTNEPMEPPIEPSQPPMEPSEPPIEPSAPLDVRAMCCAQCNAPIASSDELLSEPVPHNTETTWTYELDFLETSAWVFSATNPADVRFDVGRFGASACARLAVEGEPTLEHSWFPPHPWVNASCPICFGHLGWAFMQPATDESASSGAVEGGAAVPSAEASSSEEAAAVAASAVSVAEGEGGDSTSASLPFAFAGLILTRLKEAMVAEASLLETRREAQRAARSGSDGPPGDVFRHVSARTIRRMRALLSEIHSSRRSAEDGGPAPLPTLMEELADLFAEHPSPLLAALHGLLPEVGGEEDEEEEEENNSDSDSDAGLSP